jgi:hypothetical protein
MRLVVEKINAELMLRNLDSSQDVNRVSASLSLGVLHNQMLFYTHIGSMRSFVITSTQTLDSQEIEPGTRGLGISQNITPRFQQVEISANDVLILTPSAPLTWNATSLSGSAGLSVESLRRRLSNQAGPELKAAVFRFVEGTGKMLPVNMRFAQSEAPDEVSQPVAPVTPPATNVPPILAAVPVDQNVPHAHEKPEPIAAEVPSQPKVVVSTAARAAGEPQPGKNFPTAQPPEREIRPSLENKTPRPTRDATGAKQAAAGGMRWLNDAAAHARLWIARAIGQTLPSEGEPPVKLSNATMLTISILVPLLIVAVGASYYDRVGRGQEFATALAKAQQYSTTAETQKADPASRLANLQQSIYWLDKAGENGSSAEYTSLRNQVQGGLDELNGLSRLNFVPALDPVLESGVVIRQMVATATDLYLLDGTSGKVLRYFYAGSVFQKDTSFDCGPNASPLGASIGAVVDMVALPSGNSLGATLLVIDQNGTIEYCTPSQAGLSNALIAPDAGWGKLQAITLSQGSLYVLDSAMNMVYRYDGTSTEFPDKPNLFFDEQVPNLGEAIDIEVNGDELYILRSNGEMVECTYSTLKALKATQCQAPAPYGDMRAGQSPQAVSFPDAKFIQMHMTQAPDSSLYVLDAAGKTIYHFSLQRNLQRVYLPSFENNATTKLEPSAFAVSPGRLVFMALQNDVQFSQLP